jgi:hypothetical protein
LPEDSDDNRVPESDLKEWPSYLQRATKKKQKNLTMAFEREANAMVILFPALEAVERNMGWPGFWPTWIFFVAADFSLPT